MLLSAIGKDANNQMDSISWAIVNCENKDSGWWFLEFIQDELRLGDGNRWSVISDRQKVIT